MEPPCLTSLKVTGDINGTAGGGEEPQHPSQNVSAVVFTNHLIHVFFYQDFIVYSGGKHLNN